MPQALLQRRQRLKEWLGSREDELSQTLSRVVGGELIDGRILDRSPLSHEERKRLAALAQETHPRLIEELAEKITRLRHRISRLDPFDIIGRMLVSNVFIEWGEFYEPTHQGLEAKVELIAGIAATLPPDSSAVSGHDRFEEAMGVIEEVDDYFELAMLANATAGAAQSRGGAEDEILYRTRGEWLLLRGDSYSHHSEDLGHAIYAEIADWLHEEFGFALPDLVAVELGVTHIIEERYNAYRHTALGKIEELVEQARADTGPQQLQAAFREQGETELRHAAAAYVWTVTDFGRLLSFTPDELSEAVEPSTKPRIRAVLERLSIEIGSVSESEFSSALSVNPLVGRPFLRWGDRYMLPVPGMLAREYATLLEEEILQRRPSFKDHRARILDELALEYLAAMLPGSDAHGPLYYWVVENGIRKRAELDGLVLFDDVALVVEGKASTLSLQSRRGDVRRLAADIKKTVQRAWEQGARARRFLLAPEGAVFEDEKGEEVLRLPPNRVRTVFIVNPTLHAMGRHAVQLGGLRAIGLFPEGEFPWSVYINDLRIIAETADNPAVFLHYLVWRNRFPLGTRVRAADEIDLFGAYLKGEPIHDLLQDDPDASVDIASFSTDFDDFYGWETGHGPRVPRPRKFLPILVRRFVDRLAHTRPAGWLEATGVCLDMSAPELRGLQTTIPRLVRGLRPREVVAAASDHSAIVALGRDITWQEAWERLRPTTAARRVVFAQAEKGKARIVWALSVTNELWP